MEPAQNSTLASCSIAAGVAYCWEEVHRHSDRWVKPEEAVNQSIVQYLQPFKTTGRGRKGDPLILLLSLPPKQHLEHILWCQKQNHRTYVGCLTSVGEQHPWVSHASHARSSHKTWGLHRPLEWMDCPHQNLKGHG